MERRMNLYEAAHLLRGDRADYIYLSSSDFEYTYNKKKKKFIKRSRWGKRQSETFENIIEYFNDIDLAFMNWIVKMK